MKKCLFLSLVLPLLIGCTSNPSPSYTSSSNNSSSQSEDVSLPTYTIKFYDDEGSLLTTMQKKEGESVSYSTSKEPESKNIYEFMGWGESIDCDPDDASIVLPNAYKDVKYYAIFSKETRMYKICWMDGTHLIEEQDYTYNAIPSYSYNKHPVGDISYIFKGWANSPNSTPLSSLPNVREDAEYYAIFEERRAVNTAIKNKVILMGGQSNMEGHDSSWNSLDNATIQKYRNGHDNVLIDYNCTYCATYEGGSANTSNGNFVSVDFGQGSTRSNLGPEVGLAYYLGVNDPTDNYYLIKSCEGSSTLYNHWSATGSCYNTFVNDVDAAIKLLNDSNIPFEIVGFMWMQGESDSDGFASSYEYNMLSLIDRIKTRYSNYISSRGLSIIDAGISTDGTWREANIINQAKKNIVATNDMYRYIKDSETLPKLWAYHYTADSYLKLGEDFGECLLDAIQYSSFLEDRENSITREFASDISYYKNQQSLRNIKKDCTLVCGDSFFDSRNIWSDFYNNVSSEDDKDVFNSGISNTTLDDWYSFAPQLIYKLKPKNIVIHLGMNDFWDDMKAVDSVYNRFTALMDDIHYYLPLSTVYYFGVENRLELLPGKTSEETISLLKEFNNKTKQYGIDNSFFKFVDSFTHFSNEDGTPNLDLLRDGVHPKKAEYRFYIDEVHNLNCPLIWNNL